MDLSGGAAITQTEWTPPTYLGVGVEDALVLAEGRRCSIDKLLDLSVEERFATIGSAKLRPWPWISEGAWVLQTGRTIEGRLYASCRIAVVRSRVYDDGNAQIAVVSMDGNSALDIGLKRSSVGDF
jgi:hypothetical protein